MATPVSFGSILKVVQEDGTDINDIIRKSPLMSNTKHVQDFHGEEIRWSLAYSGLGGGSYTATVAEANDVNSEYLRFAVSPKSAYSYRTINGRLTRQALQGGVSTEYIDYLRAETKMSTSAVFAKVATSAFRTSTGRVAVRSSVSSNTITLTRKSDVYLINKGDIIVAAATDGGALRTGETFVVSRDPAAGTITVDDVTDIASFTNADSIYIKGDTGGTGMFGLGAFNPLTAPTSGDAVFGSSCDRSVDPEACAGIRFDTTGMSKATCLINFMAYLEQTPGYDGSDGMVYCHSNDIADIQVALESSRFIKDDNEYGIGVQALRCGTAVFTADPFAVQGEFRFVPKGAEFELHTINGFNVDDSDGQTMVRKAGDSYVLRGLAEGNFICKSPGKLGVGSWPSS